MNPGVPIPPEATAVHGITDDDVADCPTFRAIAPGPGEVTSTAATCAGFNILKYDLRLLAAEYNRAGVAFPVAGRKVIDACHIFHQRERRDLTAAYRFYCGLEHEGAHGAAADVLATLAILDAQVSRYDDLPRTIDGLHEHCNDPKAPGPERDVRQGRGGDRSSSSGASTRAGRWTTSPGPSRTTWSGCCGTTTSTTRRRIASEALKQAG